jgi:hypothetical protein
MEIGYFVCACLKLRMRKGYGDRRMGIWSKGEGE